MELAHHETGDMIAAPASLLQKNSVQHGRGVHGYVGFLGQFTRKTGELGFSRLDAPAGKIPAVDVGVANQQSPALGVNDDGADAEPNGVAQTLPQAARRLQPSFG